MAQTIRPRWRMDWILGEMREKAGISEEDHERLREEWHKTFPHAAHLLAQLEPEKKE